ncbi:MAG TPA: ABC transporter permease [Thermoanaerobaculia bacterium]|jgi:putative ABC transport system permease protein|nr:ABC transporter permease [Thermoanaerobaculia bacterium]
MIPREALRAGLDSLAAHKLRAALATLGVIFGVGAVIAMLSIGKGAEKQALALVERLGLRNLVVRGRTLDDEAAKEIRKKSLGVSMRDLSAIREAIPGVELAVPRIRLDATKIEAAGARADAVIWGAAPEQAQLSRLDLAEGRYLDALDQATSAQVCVLGPSVRRDLFGQEPALGRPVKIGDVWLIVVGVLAASAGGDSFEGVSIGSTAREVYLPVATAERKFEREPLAAPLDEIAVRLAPGIDIPPAAAALAALLGRLHGGAEDYDLVVPETLLEQNRRTQRLFNIVMGAIAGISLLVGGIGIMNIMLASVLERTREIGLRRAVGARSQDIRTQFLAEAFAISGLGGLAGVILGLAIAKGVSLGAGWATVVTLPSILLATGVALAVGLASGFYPAARAAQLDPIEALRYE